MCPTYVSNQGGSCDLTCRLYRQKSARLLRPGMPDFSVYCRCLVPLIRYLLSENELFGRAILYTASSMILAAADDYAEYHNACTVAHHEDMRADTQREAVKLASNLHQICTDCSQAARSYWMTLRSSRRRSLAPLTSSALEIRMPRLCPSHIHLQRSMLRLCGVCL